jgi:hypothetical protein
VICNDHMVNVSRSLFLEVLPSSRLQRLHPNVCSLALLFVNEFRSLFGDCDSERDVDNRRCAMIVALLSAERLCAPLLPNHEFWAETTGISVHGIVEVETAFMDELSCWDMSKLLDRLGWFFMNCDDSQTSLSQ